MPKKHNRRYARKHVRQYVSYIQSCSRSSSCCAEARCKVSGSCSNSGRWCNRCCKYNCSCSNSFEYSYKNCGPADCSNNCYNNCPCQCGCGCFNGCYRFGGQCNPCGPCFQGPCSCGCGGINFCYRFRESSLFCSCGCGGQGFCYRSSSGCNVGWNNGCWDGGQCGPNFGPCGPCNFGPGCPPGPCNPCNFGPGGFCPPCNPCAPNICCDQPCFPAFYGEFNGIILPPRRLQQAGVFAARNIFPGPL